MGASEILEVLKVNGELTCLEISEQVECSMQSVKQTLRSLLKDVSEDIKFRVLTPEEKIERYGQRLGCRIRVYWLNE